MKSGAVSLKGRMKVGAVSLKGGFKVGRCVHEADEKWGGESKGADEKWGGESVTPSSSGMCESDSSSRVSSFFVRFAIRYRFCCTSLAS